MTNRITESFQDHKSLLAEFEKTAPADIQAAAELIVSVIRNGGSIYICGNGGSAADAQHIAAELVGRFLRERIALPAVALSTDTSILTAVGNDYGFEEVFARQVAAFAETGDILWAFSTSGTSPNIIRAVELAKEIGAKVIGFTGKSDTTLEKMSDVCICANCDTSYGAQQLHQLAYHIICDLVESEFADQKIQGN